VKFIRPTLAAALALAPLAVLATSTPAAAVATPKNWTASLPTGASLSATTSLKATTCYSSTQCVTIGSDTVGSETLVPMAVTTNLTTGTSSVRELPLPSQVTATVGGDVNTVACVSTSACVAVGLADMSGTYEPFAISWLANSPTSVPTVTLLPSIPNADANSVNPSGVTCWAVTACRVVGSYDAFDAHNSTHPLYPFVDTLSSSGWTESSVTPTFTDLRTDGSVGLDGIACSSSTSCLVIGTYAAASLPSNQTAEFSATYSGTAFSQLQKVPGVSSPSEAHDLTCASASLCWFLDLDFVHVRVGATWSGGWTMSLPPQQPVNDWLYPEFAGCSSSFCEGGGEYGTASLGVPSAYTTAAGSGINPVAATVPLSSALPTLNRVAAEYPTVSGACPTTYFCVMVTVGSTGINVTIPSLAPSSPTGVTITDPPTGGTKISWNGPTQVGAGVASYDVTVFGSSGAVYGPTSVKTASITVSGLTLRQSYYTQVVTIATDGQVSPFSQVSFTKYDASSAPRKVTVTSTTKACALTWQAPTSSGGSSVNGYLLAASWSGGQVVAHVGVVAKGTITGLAAGRKVAVTVSAVTAAGPGAASAPLSCIPKA